MIRYSPFGRFCLCFSDQCAKEMELNILWY